MKINISVGHSNWIANMTEAQLTTLSLMHEIQKTAPDKSLVFYMYDLMTMINYSHATDPHKAFTHMTRCFRAKLINDYQLEIQMRSWQPEDFEVEIESARNIAMYWHVMNQTPFDETAENKAWACNLKTGTHRIRHFTKWIKTSHTIYDPSGKKGDRYLGK